MNSIKTNDLKTRKACTKKKEEEEGRNVSKNIFKNNVSSTVSPFLSRVRS